MSYIGNEPIVSATRTITEVTATAGQTVFVANGGYTVGYIDVFLNGAQLQTVDFTATNGSSITLTEAAQAGDVIRLVAWGTFNSANLNGAGLIDGTVTQAKFGTGVSGTGPAFSVSRITSGQSVTAATYTKVQFNSVNFDTASNWDAANYRFIPSVAGYYQFNLIILTQIIGSTDKEIIGTIWKNGSEAALAITTAPANNVRGTAQVSAIIYMNGTTDYVEGYGYISAGTSPIFVASATRTQFSGCLVRAS